MKITAVDVTRDAQPGAGGPEILVIDVATGEGVDDPGPGLTLDAESAAQHRVE